MGFYYKDILKENLRTSLKTNVHWGQRAVMNVDGKSEWVKIEEVRQGSVLSLDLFSLYSQVVMDEMVDMEGVSVGE